MQRWINEPPAWLEVHDDVALLPQVGALDDGEAAAISLAISISADMVLIDEREGFRVAQVSGLRVTGTLGVLLRAAQRGLVDLGVALERLRQTNFRYRSEMFEALLKQQKDRKPL